MNKKQEHERNAEVLKQIREDEDAPASVKIQAIQQLEKMLNEGGPVDNSRPTCEDIMKQIRAKKNA